VYASAEKLAQVRALVAKMDRRPPNVSVEARIVAVNRDKMRKVGLAYSLGRMRNDSTGHLTPAVDVRQVTPQGGITSMNGPAFDLRRHLGNNGRIDLNVFIDAVIGHGIAETQTTPMITTLSDVPALIRVGDAFVLPNNQPILAGGGYYPPYGDGGQWGGQAGMGGSQRRPGGYGDGNGGLQPGGYGGIQPDYGLTAGGFTRFETGTALKVTPYVLGDGLIRVKIDLERDGGTLSPDGRSITGGNQAAYSDVIVPVGTPIVIGGLTVNAKSRGSSGVPILSDLPLIGSLFRVDESAERYQDLIIIVTPRIDDEEYDLASR
jgi:type II secretory pathway component GspD/PulD (secretin)